MDEKQSQEREQLILGRFYKQRRLDSIPKVKKYLIKDAFGGQRAEIKTMMIGQGRPNVLHEAGFLQQNQGYPGFPLMIWSGNYNNKEMGLITEPLGLSLQQLLDAHPDKRFSLGTVCMIGLQIINIVQILHDKHLVIENLSPSVFRLYPSKVQQIMVSELLHCKRYRNSKNFQIFKLKKIQAIDFFNHFMSFNKISGFNTSRRDDIESLFYMMVYFLKGQLPWSAIPLKFDSHTCKVIQKVYNELLMDGQSKIKNDLLEGLPGEFISIFEYLCQLGFQDQPNYSLIRMKLKKVLLKTEQHQEPVLDWLRYLPSLHKEVLLPKEIKMQTFQDEVMLKRFYYPWEDKINLDSFSGVNFSSSEHGQRQNGVSPTKKFKHRSKCQLI